MSWNLHIAKVHKIEYDCPGLSGSDAHLALAQIFNLFEINASSGDTDEDDFEIDRAELIRLRDMIVNNDQIVQEEFAEFDQYLSRTGLTRDEFVNALTNMIEMSDQDNDTVYFSWY